MAVVRRHFSDYPGPGAEEVRGHGGVLFLRAELDESPLVFGCRVIRLGTDPRCALGGAARGMDWKVDGGARRS